MFNRKTSFWERIAHHMGDLQELWRPVGGLLGRLALILALFAGMNWCWGAHQRANRPLLIAGDPPRLFSGQMRDDLHSLITRSLQRAKKTVYLEIFALDDPGLIQSLNRLARQGVRVQLATDRYSIRSLDKLDAKIEFRIAPTSGIMHRKILIVDDEAIWLGSANATEESLNLHHNLLIGLKSPVMAEFLKGPASAEAREFAIAGQAVEVGLLPNWRAAQDKLIREIDRAQSSINIAMFAWTQQDLADAVLRAKDRGVRVRIALDRKSAQTISESVVRKLIEGGVEVRLSLGLPLLHHKFAWIDERSLWAGSVNWTNAGFRKNHEVLVHLPQVTYEQQRWLEKLWARCWLEATPPPPLVAQR